MDELIEEGVRRYKDSGIIPQVMSEYDARQRLYRSLVRTGYDLESAMRAINPPSSVSGPNDRFTFDAFVTELEKFKPLKSVAVSLNSVTVDKRASTTMSRLEAILEEGYENVDHPIAKSLRTICEAYERDPNNWSSRLDGSMPGGIIFFAIQFERFVRPRIASKAMAASKQTYQQAYQQASYPPSAEQTREINRLTGECLRLNALAQGIQSQRDTEIQRREKVQAEFLRLTEVLTRITSAPKYVGQVLAVRDREVEINVRGTRIEVPVPTVDGNPSAPEVGDMVRVAADSMQILEVIPREQRFITGQMVELSAVDGAEGEVELLGNKRLVALGPLVAEAGDRVVLDETGTIALKNKGREPSKVQFGEQTGVHWDDIGGQHEAKRALRDAIESPVRDRDRFAAFGRRASKGVLLYGPPGCGKTMLGKAAATAMAELHGAEGGGAFHYVKGPELLDMFVGQTERAVRKIFSDARRYRKERGHPCVVFIDEADAILGRRSSGVRKDSGGTMTDTVVPQFLAEMDGLEDAGLFLLLATNRPDALDAAVVCDGRIDRRVKVGRPAREDVRVIIGRSIAGRPFHQKCVDAIVDEIYNPAAIVAKVRRHSKGELTDKLRFSDILSGALVVGIVERAAEIAMSSASDLVTDQHARHAARASFNESLDVDHTDELWEVIGENMHDVAGVTKGSPLAFT